MQGGSGGRPADAEAGGDLVLAGDPESRPDSVRIIVELEGPVTP
ncbi:hypothetical protein [Streptomyces violaceusniger]|nr:hypothetical protein [Streptomyces violaceusniger]